MKKFACLLFAFTLATMGFAQTADEVINKFIEASGGIEKLDGITTLQYQQLMKIQSPMGAFEIPMKFYKEKDRLFRVQSNMQLGAMTMTFFTLLNDTAGYMMLPANPMTGSEASLLKMEEKDRKNAMYQMDVQGLFGGLVNYAAKGNRIEKLKDENVNKEDCYKIKMRNGQGQEVIYFISKATNLVVRQDAKGEIAAEMSGLGGIMGGMGAGGRVEKMEVTILYNDYKAIDGIQFPAKWIIKTAMGDNESELTNIKINQTIDAKMYIAE